MALPLLGVPERRLGLPDPLRDPTDLRGQAHVLHGDGHGSVLSHLPRAAVAVRPHRQGRRLRHGHPLPHRVHLLQRHHGVRAHLRRGILRRHLRQVAMDLLR